MRHALYVIATLGLAVSSGAQHHVIVGPASRVNDPGTRWFEATVAARLSSSDEVVVCAIQRSPTFGLRYRTSLDGGATWSDVFRLPMAADPGLVVDPFTDDIWAIGLGPGMTVSAAWKEPGEEQFQDAYPIVVHEVGYSDHVLMAIGPEFGGGPPPRYYALYGLPVSPNTALPLWSAFSENPYNGLEWTTQRLLPQPGWAGDDYKNWGANPVVLDTGRIVVATRGWSESGASYNNNLPYVVYADSYEFDGTTINWLPDDPDLVGVARDAGISAVRPLGMPRCGELGDTPCWIDQRVYSPAIAVDPNNNNLVYVAFYARRERFDESPPDRNSDIYVVRSTDGGVTFPSDEFSVLQLKDELLGIQNPSVSGHDQVMPSLAVDGCGGVNLVFYDNRNPDSLPPPVSGEDWWDVYYVRIMNFGPTPSIYQKRLTTESFTPQTIEALGHYDHFAAAGPDRRVLYPAYIRPNKISENPPEWEPGVCYVHKIRIYCLSDLNTNGVSDPEDVALFNAAFDAGTSDSSGGGGGDADLAQMADLNEDGVVDLEDYDLFWDQYLNGCGGS